jgi:hypothetical protein
VDERFIFASWFERFQSKFGWFCCFWASGKAEHHGGKPVVEQHSSLHGVLEAEIVI